MAPSPVARVHPLCWLAAILVVLLSASCWEERGPDAPAGRGTTIAPPLQDPTSSSTGETRSKAAAPPPLTKEGYARGAEGASLVVYEFSDFGCRYCGEFAREVFPALRREFVDTGRVRWVFIPSEGAYPNGAEAGRASICAGEQDRFWGMHDLLFAHRREWMGPRDPEPVLQTYARRLELDLVRFTSCYHGAEARERLKRASRLSLLLGIRATPSFYVGGRLVEGALSVPVFRGLLQETLDAGSASPQPHRSR